MPFWLVLVVIGLLGGFAAGLFGVGGGIVIVPALIYWAGFTQHKATGTSLAVLLPPIGLLAALEYYRHGNVDVRAAVILATMMMIGAWAGAYVANRIRGPHLRLAFGVFVCGIGIYLSRLWSMQATRMVVDDLGSIARPFWQCVPRAGTPEGSRHLIAVEQWDGVAAVAIPPPSAGLVSRHSLPPRRLPPHSLLMLVGAIPQGYPAREAHPRVRSRSSVPPWAMMPESWARLYWRVNTSCTRKVA
jgi:uncharacterized protein